MSGSAAAAAPQGGATTMASPGTNQTPQGYHIINDSPLTAHLSTHCSKSPELRHALWHALTGETEDLGFLTRGTDAYFVYYDGIVQRYRWKCSIKTHLELIKVVRELRTSTTLDEILRELAVSAQDIPFSGAGAPDANNHSSPAPSGPLQQERVKATVWLAARVLSMNGIGRFPDTIPGAQTVPWVEGCLSDKLKQMHKVCQNPANDVLLNFDAAKLEKIARLNIKFSDNLDQHLRLHKDKGGWTLFVFHHVRFLEIMDQNHHGALFPPDFLAETMRTLDLLFPAGNEMVMGCFKARIIDDTSVDSLLLMRSRTQHNIHFISAQYPYWRDRLIAVNQLIVNTQPESMWEAMLDHRNPGTRLSIMLAFTALLLTAFFGLVQSIEGGIQVYKAYVPTVGP